MRSLDEIVNDLESLSPASLQELERFIEYLRWKEAPHRQAEAGATWNFDLVEEFHRAVVSADRSQAGMHVQVGETACSGEWRMALWQHPPVQGAAVVEYQVPIPANVRNVRLLFATGIRDGSQLAPGNIVAFRVFVNDWRLWSHTQHACRWLEQQVAMPSLPGDVIRVQLVTDGLGNHEWAWAAWAEPRLVGEVLAR
ncbi:MAG TPA: hypothetical protein PKO09_00535 [Anaerolineae bacterium]|nr:hypothetical protein [Anaerolineae bacterium]